MERRASEAAVGEGGAGRATPAAPVFVRVSEASEEAAEVAASLGVW